MKKTINFILCSFIIFQLSGCATQEPVAQSPVYNITLTDNSQWVVGDNNTAKSTAETKTEQVAEPAIEQTTENTTKNGAWIVWLAIITILGIGGYFLYKRTRV